MTRFHLAAPIAAALLAACGQMPTGPTVSVFPGQYKPFEVFMQDDALCRGWAAHSVGIPGNDEAARAFLGSVAVGAAIGALAGAAAGGHRSTGGGAAAGTAIGAMVGANRSSVTGWNAQHSYNIAYQQCMYAQGNQVPGVAARGAYPPNAVPPPAR